MSAFLKGFEKRSYDYAHERQDLLQRYDAESRKPEPDVKAHQREGRAVGGIVGGLYGGVMGGMIGAGTKRPLKGGLIGAGLGVIGGGLVGMGLGHLSGKASAMAEKLGIEEAKRIMAMPKKERSAYLHHLARQNEISEREAEEWSRVDYQESKEDRRHRERMDVEHDNQFSSGFYKRASTVKSFLQTAAARVGKVKKKLVEPKT